jgi:hypothetical protein
MRSIIDGAEDDSGYRDEPVTIATRPTNVTVAAFTSEVVDGEVGVVDMVRFHLLDYQWVYKRMHANSSTKLEHQWLMIMPESDNWHTIHTNT